jgi:hypothetical protein
VVSGSAAATPSSIRIRLISGELHCQSRQRYAVDEALRIYHVHRLDPTGLGPIAQRIDADAA